MVYCCRLVLTFWRFIRARWIWRVALTCARLLRWCRGRRVPRSRSVYFKVIRSNAVVEIKDGNQTGWTKLEPAFWIEENRKYSKANATRRTRTELLVTKNPNWTIMKTQRLSEPNFYFFVTGKSPNGIELLWHKLGEVDLGSHKFIVLAISMPKIIKFGGYLTKFWQKQVGSFFLAHPVWVRTTKINSKSNQTNTKTEEH